MTRIIKIIIVLFIGMPSLLISGQSWLVPSEESGIINPSEYTIKNVSQGKDLYLKNCKSCHGDPGKYNQLALVPVPPDVVSEKMQSNSEGDLHYKISTGLGAMPQFETTISESDRWKLVNFIMNFNPGKNQLLVDLPPVKAKLFAAVDEEKNMIEIIAEYENEKAEYEKLAGASVTISTRMTFGKLDIGVVTTNEDGKAVYFIPETIIGNELGLLNLVVTLNDL